MMILQWRWSDEPGKWRSASMHVPRGPLHHQIAQVRASFVKARQRRQKVPGYQLRIVWPGWRP